MHPVLNKFWQDHGERFAELLAVGKVSPEGYGVIAIGGLYGREGLTQDEFLELIHMRSYVSGLCDALGRSEVNTWIQTHIEEAWKAREKANDEHATTA